VWAQDRHGRLRAFHPECARRFNVRPTPETRQPYDTKMCMGCGHFLDAPPCEHTPQALGLSQHAMN
jgi:hypothetical protein